MCLDIDIDMMGEDEEMMVLQIAFAHVIYTGCAKGTDELVESWSRHFGMQVEVLVPPHHPRAQHITPSIVEVLVSNSSITTGFNNVCVSFVMLLYLFYLFI